MTTTQERFEELGFSEDFYHDLQATQPSKAKLKAWARKLRSGRYTQGRAYLRRGDNYCCLGVAFGKKGWEKDPGRSGDILIYAQGGSTGLPSKEQFRALTGARYYLDTIDVFSHANDDLQATFAEVADFLDTI